MKEIEDIYELSPVQQGILFESLYSPETSPYFEQYLFRWKGPLLLEAIQEAWKAAIERHPILRTSFHWQEVHKPLQVVRRQVAWDVCQLDWRGSWSSEEELDRRITGWLEQDRANGFDFGKAPLMRVAAIHLAVDDWLIVWSRHHLLLDRWSRFLVLQEAITLYERRTGANRALPAVPRPYSDYIGWLQKQDLSKTGEFWRTYLAGYRPELHFLPPENKESQQADYGELTVTLDADNCRRVAGSQRVTLNTFVMAAWAAVLYKRTSNKDVAFGITVSGRPATFPGIERMVGLFINTVPFRVQVQDRERIADLLHRVQRELVDVSEHHYAHSSQIRAWCGFRESKLFDALLVFENTPVDEVAPPPGVQFAGARSIGGRTLFPLILFVVPRERLAVKAVFDRGAISADSAADLLTDLATCLASFCENPQGELRGLLEEHSDRNLLTLLEDIEKLSEEEVAELLQHSDRTHG